MSSVETKNSSSFSDVDDFEVTLENVLPSLSDLTLLKTQFHYLSDFNSFYDQINKVFIAKSGDVNLGLFTTVDFNLIKKNFNKKINIKIKKLVKNFDNLQIFINERLCEFNIDFNKIFIDLIDKEKNYLFLCKMEDPDKSLKKFIKKKYKINKEINLVPFQEELIFLINFKNIELIIKNIKYGIFMLNGNEIIKNINK